MVEATYTGDLSNVRWSVDANGWLTMDYRYRHDGAADFLGVGFDLPEAAVTGMRWCGQGPYRVWKNRLLGGTLDVWDLDANDTLAGHQGWRFPESRGFFADVRWLTLRTSNGPITIRTDRPFIQVLPAKFPPASKNAMAVCPQVGFALLDAISPIGNKFHAAKDVGPQSQPTTIVEELHGTARFWFGPDPH